MRATKQVPHSDTLPPSPKPTTRLPKPGEIVYLDHRPKTATEDKAITSLRCVQWNIERGYQLDRVISILLDCNADIICLQELDIGCERSFLRDCATELAEALQMVAIFGCEFEEHHCRRRRSKRTQGGGVHGNAILSRFDMANYRLIEHTEAFDWERRGHRLGEPRTGRRYAVAADVNTPLGVIRAYSLHLELFCGIRMRVRQYEDVLSDAIAHADRVPHQLIFGDLNTMAHGVARLLPRYCRDSLRYGSLGLSEAEWWYRHVLCPKQNSLCFFDPFDRHADYTLWQANGWFFRGKLDWTLCRSMRIRRHGMLNDDFKASDHKLLWVDVEPAEDACAVYDEYLEEQKAAGSRFRYFCLFIFALIVFYVSTQ